MIPAAPEIDRMNWLRPVSIVFVFLIAVLAGGSASRALFAVTEIEAAATFALLAGLLLATILAGAKGRRWRQNPYW